MILSPWLGENKMKTLKVLIIMATAFIVCGMFISTEFGKPQQPSKATVYVYRYKLVMGSAYSPSVYCDDKQLARMDNGKYFAVAVDPGQHVFNSNDKQSRIALDVQPGRAYFIRLEISPGLWKGHGQLALVTPEQGRAELTSGKIKPLEQDKIFDHAAVSVAPLEAEAR
jgi:Protein of unknown function (DUF2846)